MILFTPLFLNHHHSHIKLLGAVVLCIYIHMGLIKGIEVGFQYTQILTYSTYVYFKGTKTF